MCWFVLGNFILEFGVWGGLVECVCVLDLDWWHSGAIFCLANEWCEGEADRFNVG